MLCSPAQHCSSLPRKGSSSPSWATPLHRPGCTCCKTVPRFSWDGAELGRGKGRWKMGCSCSEWEAGLHTKPAEVPSLPESPCDPVIHTRALRTRTPCVHFPESNILLSGLLPPFWPHICTYIIILWVENLASALKDVHKKKRIWHFMLGKLSKPVFSGRFLWFEMQACYLLPKLRDRTVVRNLKNCDKRHSGRLSWHHWGICPLWCCMTHFAQDTDCCPFLTRTMLWQCHDERSDTLGSQQSSQLAWGATALHPSLCSGWEAVLLFGRIHHLSDPSSSCLSCTVVSRLHSSVDAKRNTCNQAGKTKRGHMCKLLKDHSTHKEERKEEAGLFPWRAGIRGAQGRSQIHHLFSNV